MNEHNIDLKKTNYVIFGVALLYMAVRLFFILHPTSTQDELLNSHVEILVYLDDLAEVRAFQSVFADAHDRMTLNRDNLDMLLTILVDDLIPASYEMVEIVESLTPKTKQLQEIHAILVDAVQLIHQSCLMNYASIIEDDQEKSRMASEGIRRATELVHEYNSRLTAYYERQPISSK